MDVSDITKVASRKRMSEDAEKLRDKISRETAKIIKLKVAQDTAYWDLKEKLQQVESNHERLQQNMVEVQMQYETISGQYQDELRLRPETLNKLSGTREICDVLEEYGARLKASVARAAADRTALAAATAAAAARAAQHARAADLALAEHRHRALHSLQRLRVAEAGEAAAARDAQAAREAGAAATAEARARLDAECVRRERAVAEGERLAAQLHRRAGDIERKDRVISEMQKETQRLVSELAERRAALEESVAQRDALVAAAAERERAAGARATAAERRGAEAAAELDATHALLTAERAEVERLQASLAALSESHERLGAELAEKTQSVERRDAQVEELSAAVAALQEEAAAAERARGEAGAAQEAQLQAAGATIARLMRDVQAEADARHRLDAALKAKDDELARQVALMLDMNTEHERLRDKIAAMRNTIDNIQKELTGRGGGGGGGGGGAAEAEGGRCARPERLRAEAPPLDRMLYNFLSDASADADTLDSPLSLSQVKSELSAKHRAFFKSKKCGKPRKAK